MCWQFDAVLGKGAMKTVYPSLVITVSCWKKLNLIKISSPSFVICIVPWQIETRYRAFDELNGIEVAWNQVKLCDVLRSPDTLERMYSEVHLLSTLEHESIIRFLSSWVDVNRRTFNFITEMFTSGTLREYAPRTNFFFRTLLENHFHSQLKYYKFSRTIFGSSYKVQLMDL